MAWTWLSVFIALLAITYILAAARMRTTVLRYTEDLRKVMRQIAAQTQHLTTAREAARETKQQSVQRASELTSLRAQVAALTASLDSEKKHRKALENTLATAEKRITELRALLARSEARRDKVESELTAAQCLQYELVSKLSVDESRRMAALNHVRRPRETMITQPDMCFTPDSTPPRRERNAQHAVDELALSPGPFAKSPSESALLNLHPDITLSDSEDDLPEVVTIGVGRGINSDFALASSSSSPSLATDFRHVQSPLALRRAPWANSMTRGGRGIAACIVSPFQPAASTASPASGLVSRTLASCDDE